MGNKINNNLKQQIMMKHSFTITTLAFTASASCLHADQPKLSFTSDADKADYARFEQAVQEKGLGYNWESHVTVNDQGDSLTLFRLTADADGRKPPKAGVRGPLVLAHGLISASHIWFNSNDADRDPLPIRLFNDGYDVWFYNDRTFPYSRVHDDIDSDADYDFWDYTVQDIAEQDVPKVLEVVLEQSETCQKVSWFGHATATDIMLRALATD